MKFIPNFRTERYVLSCNNERLSHNRDTKRLVVVILNLNERQRIIRWPGGINRGRYACPSMVFRLLCGEWGRKIFRPYIFKFLYISFCISIIRFIELIWGLFYFLNTENTEITRRATEGLVFLIHLFLLIVDFWMDEVDLFFYHKGIM